MARKRGRPSKAMLAAMNRIEPASYILERRKLFSFVQVPASARLDGRNGEVDSEVCDGIGQLHACGLLDGYGYDPKDLRDAGRFYGEHYWNRYRQTAPKSASYERRDKSVDAYLGETGKDRRFDRMDEALRGYNKGVLMSLVVDTAWGDEIVPWAQALIDEALRERGIIRRGCSRFPDMHDRAMLAACIEALCAIQEGKEMKRAA